MRRNHRYGRGEEGNWGERLDRKEAVCQRRDAPVPENKLERDDAEEKDGVASPMNAPCPRILRLGSSASYTTEAQYTADTRDHEDHTFSGIMFDIVAKTTMPIKYLEIHAIWVRGHLGIMQVFVTPKSHKEQYRHPELWKPIHKGEHRPSMHNLVPLLIDPPLVLKPGDSIGLYVHSSLPNDQGLVYNNQRGRETHNDDFLRILPGMAHTSRFPFNPIGFWGHTSWRQPREFVGRLSYGVKFLLWNDNTHSSFPKMFRRAVEAALNPLVDKKSKRILPSAVIRYIFNYCPWNWFDIEETAKILNNERSSGFNAVISGVTRRLRDSKEAAKKACLIS